MRLDNIELYKFFKEIGITNLYHANTVATSITFLEVNGLLSRGEVENRGLFQTPQETDQKDQDFDVWNDVFLDTDDLHTYFNRNNIYGPVLFKFHLDLLLNRNFEIWITKNNPKYWHPKITLNDRYFIDVNELKSNWNLYERQKMMTTIRNIKNPILFNHLEKIIVDDPGIAIGQKKLIDISKQNIKEVVEDKEHLKSLFMIRECNICFCKLNYSNVDRVNKKGLIRLFYPKALQII